MDPVLKVEGLAIEYSFFSSYLTVYERVAAPTKGIKASLSMARLVFSRVRSAYTSESLAANSFSEDLASPDMAQIVMPSSVSILETNLILFYFYK